MASASVADLGDCVAFTRLGDGRAVDTLGSLGRFRANGPIAAHPTVRMHRIPPRVVLIESDCSQSDKRGHCSIARRLDPGTGLQAGWFILPRLGPYVYAGRSAGRRSTSWAWKHPSAYKRSHETALAPRRGEPSGRISTGR